MIAATTPGFDRLLGFWKLAHDGPVDVALLVADDASAPDVNDALICIPGEGPADLYTLDDGTTLFARVRRIEVLPDGAEVLHHLVDTEGNTVSFISKDPASNVITVPFVFDEAVEGFELERYVERLGTGTPPTLLKAYYRAKPFLPRALIRELRSAVARRADHESAFPSWPVERSLERLRELFAELVLDLTGDAELPFLWFWPEGRAYCLLITHDVETSSGRDLIGEFLALEGALGLRASYNLVPADYSISAELIETIRRADCEVGVHGWTHDGLLFSDRELFAERVEKMRAVADEWGAVGFRSPATHRNPDWFGDMGFDYDSSAPDTDPFEPQAGGCLSVFPFFVGDVVEIPITMPQDHTLFALLKAQDTAAWERKAHVIAARHGVVCMLAHPDGMTGYSGSDAVRPLYRGFLEQLCASHADYWNPVPRELSAWWRERQAAQVTCSDGDPGVRGELRGAAFGVLRRNGHRALAIEPPQDRVRVAPCAV